MRGNEVREKKLEREVEKGGNGDAGKTQFQMPTVGVKIKNIKNDIILFRRVALIHIHNICRCYYYAIVVHMYMYYTKIPRKICTNHVEKNDLM